MNYNGKLILIIILLILIIYIYISNTENFTTLTNPIQNISSMYNANTLSATNMNITGNMNTTGNIDTNGNINSKTIKINNSHSIDSSGNIVGNNLKIGDNFIIDISGNVKSSYLDKSASQDIFNFIAGCIILNAPLDTNNYNQGLPIIFNIGIWNLTDNSNINSINNSTIIIIVNPGFMCRFTNLSSLTTGNILKVWNISPKPIRLQLGSIKLGPMDIPLPYIPIPFSAVNTIIKSDGYNYISVAEYNTYFQKKLIKCEGFLPSENSITLIQVLKCISIDDIFIP